MHDLGCGFQAFAARHDTSRDLSRQQELRGKGASSLFEVERGTSTKHFNQREMPMAVDEKVSNLMR